MVIGKRPCSAYPHAGGSQHGEEFRRIRNTRKCEHIFAPQHRQRLRVRFEPGGENRDVQRLGFRCPATPEQQLAENYAAALEEVLRVKPSAAKGRYLKKVTFATTMGPGIQVDANRVRNVAVDEEA